MTGKPELQVETGDHGGRADPACDGSPQPGRADLEADEQIMCIQELAGLAAALLTACVAPASAMVALWSTTSIGWSVLALFFHGAFGRAALLGLPLFLIFRSARWVNGVACSIAGFVVGAGPAAVLGWPQPLQPDLTMSTMAELAAHVERWIGYVTPPMHFGLFGALVGLAFWLVTSTCAAPEPPAIYVQRLPSRRANGKAAGADQQALIGRRTASAGTSFKGRVTPLAQPPLEASHSLTTRTAPLAALEANAA